MKINSKKVKIFFLLAILVLTTPYTNVIAQDEEIVESRLNKIMDEIKASEKKPLGHGFEDDPVKALERIEVFEQMEKSDFRKETALKMGLAGLIIFLKRKSILKSILFISKIGSKVVSSNTLLGFAQYAKYITTIGMFLGLYLHSADAGSLEDTLTGYYSLHLDEFLELPMEHKKSLLIIYNLERPEPSVLVLRQKIFALDKFLEMAVKTAEINRELEDINNHNGVDKEDPKEKGFFTY